MARPVRALAIGVLLMGAAVGPARAAFHLMKVVEVFPGTTNDPNAQFIELQMYSAGQNLVGGHAVRVYGATGAVVATFTFPANVAGSADQSSILLATTEAQSRFTISADLIISASLPLAGGAVCFESIDCVSWGSFSGSLPSPAGAPLNPGDGLVRSASATRDISGGNGPNLDFADDTNDSANEFDLVPPTPRNNAGNDGVVLGCVATFSTQAYEEIEGAFSGVQITVNACANQTVEYSTADGTATAGSDYVATSGTLSFGSGTQRFFTIDLIDDSVWEGPAETFTVRLRNPSAGAYLRDPNATVTLTESSPPPAPPTAPLNLTATGGTNQISLAWEPPASQGAGPITGYRIYRGPTSGSETLLTSIGLVTSFVDSGLPNAATRFYRVSAVNVPGGEGPRSVEVTAQTDPNPPVPTAPQGIAASGGLRQISVTWQAPASDGGSPILGYKLFEGSSSLALGLLATLGPEIRSYNRVGLANGATRFYRLTAFNANGEGAPSATVSATTFNVPSAPRSLAATAGNGLISLTWQPPLSNEGTPLTGYRIYRGTATGAETPLTTVGIVNSFTDTGLPQGAFRSYRVSATNLAGEGPLSNTAGATTFAPPSAPVQLNASPGGTVGEIVLSWQQPPTTGGAPITSYSVYRSTGGGKETEAGTSTGTTFSDRGLAVGTKYLYRVTASNVAGEGPFSNQVCQRPFPWLNTVGCLV